MTQLVLVAALSIAADLAVDFDTEIVPILTKAGCNAAACHGAAAGRGGLKLSLFGGDPAWDHAAIVHQLEGRRVNLVRPAESLILAKPTEQIIHEGGYRLEHDGVQAGTLLRWITEGAGRRQARRCTTIDVVPQRFDAAVDSRHQLAVRAHYDDGTSEDVSSLAVYTSTDPAAVEVSPTGELTVRRRGRHALIVSYLSHVLPIQVTVPLAAEPVSLADHPCRNWIDDQILATLTALHLVPSPPADDGQQLRRVHLDLTGRLPTIDQTRRYLADPDPEKYGKLVDRLLVSEAFVEYWTYRLATLLRVRSQPNDAHGALAFHTWLARQLRDDVPWSRTAASMVLAAGDTHQNGPANFYRIVRGAREQAEYTTESLLGVRLRCANCHNHPLDRWTQDDYHGLAAIFARVEQGRVVRIRDRGDVIHPATGDPARPRIPGVRFVDAGDDGRQALVDWMIDPENPLFAKAMVNRIWKALMGRGLIEPSDDLRATNPATHPALLDRLAEDFVAHDFQLRHTVRLIVTSAAYVRSHVASAANRHDDRFYSHALTKPLAAEVLADAIADVTGVPNRYASYPEGTRAIQLHDPRTAAPALDLLGRCSREASCEARFSGGGLAAQLHLLNGDFLNAKIDAPAGRLQRMIEAGASTAEVIDTCYLAALARRPNRAEAEYWAAEIGDQGPQRREKLEDFLWSLLNDPGFTTNP